jgi:DNA-directed RNA polymerase I, II, and III subunit RPABC3
MADSSTLFEDTFEVAKLNPDGKKFDRVSRIVARGETYEVDLTLDVASEVYPLRVGDKFTLVLASTLRLDGKPDEDTFNQDGKPTLLDQFEYGMCGRTFKFDHVRDNVVSVIASFGGLLMQLQGEQRHLIRVRMDQRIYCLLRRTG